MTCMTMKRKAKESDVEPLTATDYMEALPHGMTGLSVRVQREVLQKWHADEQEVARLRGLLEGVANGDGYTTQLGGALIMKCDTYGKTDLHYRLERVTALLEEWGRQVEEFTEQGGSMLVYANCTSIDREALREALEL